MSRTRLAALAAGATALAAAAMFPQASSAAAGNTAAPSPSPDTAVVYRVPAHHKQDAQKLVQAGYDLLERRQGDDLFVLGDRNSAAGLRRLGFTPTVESTMPRSRPSAHARPDADGTYDGGYHTVDAHYAHLDQVAAAHPDMATVVTYGQSWLKQAGAGGHDLKAICITRIKPGDCQLNPNAAKPRFFLMSQIHAREITTGEMSWRWIDTLTNDYGKDPDITRLMDSTEMWVVPIANPDGVDIVAQGGDNPVLQRKNADNANGVSCGWTGQTGVDLNRNAGTHWGGLGTSTQPCSEVYLGPAADSEAENTGLESLFRQLYPAVRTGTGDSDPAPADAKGMMISLHSDASMVLFPWEADHTIHSGNDATLRALAAHMGSITGYQSGQAGEILYDASGGTDDWTYDKLGLASFTIEIGDVDGRGCSGFTPSFSCQDSYFWPKIKPALLYAAQHAAAPYQASSDESDGSAGPAGAAAPDRRH
ncbi:M14 family zinc carboxypeptidase [Streptomyces morookaense]|uniref:Zinc carboxypeptidase n=1 Tax=Streptomyces morookaense TaxID=1970 RepID=A0A7Y7EAD1_STRMO|nr:M14 family zinc carboxypeptidase [Streptomyces morookaense]NVK81347.1 carboxypeptidase [Streptomyces morookaense]GHF35566.1 peptidase M14 [Streptomyces morookaense]